VFGLEEDIASLKLMYDAIANHCKLHNVPCPEFGAFVDGVKRERVKEIFHAEDHSWMAAKMHGCLCPPEWEQFAAACFRDKKTGDDLLQFVPPYIDPVPTIHTDGGLAFAAFFPQVGWNSISCAIHLLSNVAGCDSELKTAIKTLLYERNMSSSMAETLSKWATKLATEKPISAPTRNKIIAMFGSPEAMQKNTQAFKNFVYSAWYSCDTVLEALFKHTKDDQRCVALKQEILG
jgi:hypothetical protein